MVAVKLRQLPGALILGLLASILAHTAIFGSGHQIGGTYHDVLISAAVATGGGFLLLLSALAWISADRGADGSIVATLLRARLPSLAGLIPVTAGWFALIEALEPYHEIGGFAMLALLVVSSAALVLSLARAALDVLATVVLAVCRSRFAARTRAATTLADAVFFQPAVAHAFRRFARPPPAAMRRA